ncbi:MAG: flippase-like domain-containing protein [Spirochaetes bacterium]|nr:flippase-like domain-containing protein [Spirochaetota bacterium]
MPSQPNSQQAPQGADQILTERKRRIFSARTAIFLVLSLSLGYFLLSKLDIGKSFEIIRNANARLIAACFVTYFAADFFKMLRIKVMLGGHAISLVDLFVITSYHNFFNQIMPARTGELTFVYYMKKIGNVDLSKGLHILVVTRIFDIIVIAAFFICSIILFFGKKTSPALVAVGLLFLALSIVILFNLKWLVIWSGKLFHVITKKTGMVERPLVAKVLGKIDVVVEEFSSFRAGRFIPLLALTSILTWIALYLLFYLSIRSFGIEIGLLQSVAGSTGGVLTNVLPINTFGSFGTLEAGWTGGFMLVGMSQHDAIFTGFGYHVIVFTASAVVAFLCFAAKKIWK